MSNDVADAQMLPEAVRRLVAGAVDASGHAPCKIADWSEGTARDFSQLDPGLRGHGFSPALLSRWCSGKKIKSARREKMIVLRVTLLRLDEASSYRSWSDVRRKAALDEGVAFAKLVGDAARDSRAATESLGLRNKSARYARAVDLLDGYGTLLLARAEEDEGASAAKLALLHQLNGDVDDARYWSARASAENSDNALPSSREELFARARQYAAEYRRARDLDAERMYLIAAADCGDGKAAYRLGQAAEMDEDLQEAISRYLLAENLGYSEGGQRAEQLRASLA
ncbi:hypothetical protein ACU635_08765 [[Actinomadura] parvosata]|uniref:hypothetical protein n=1 Tax=[Actinomadura] parvosata TaxID=1955412 RepID=UPI00406C031D